MRLGALTLLCLVLSLLAAAGILGYAFYSGDRRLALNGLGLLGLAALLFIVYRVLAASAHCPLCRGPVLAGSGAQRNRSAKRTLGSHRLHVARCIIFSNSFVCPYCNEATQCRIKPRLDGEQTAEKRSAYRK